MPTKNELLKAKNVVRLCEDAYLGGTLGVSRFRNHYGFTKVKYYRLDTGTEWYVMEACGLRWFVFIGSNGPIDWMQNLKVNPYPMFPVEGLAHWGFIESAREWVRWYNQSEYAESSMKTVLAGHSAGAACAALAALAIKPKLLRTFLFGCPRIGNEEFVASYNSQLYDITLRYECGRDFVHFVPIWWDDPDEPNHVGITIRLKPNEKRRLGYYLRSYLSDHKISTYRDEIDKANAAEPITAIP